jgi:2-oxoglutarate/2-oxoacid ferredoxin oxidoreductase subunit alpha
MSAMSILIAGAAGQGVQSAAGILGKTLHRLGYFVYTSQDYQSRVRGGHNFMQIRFHNEPLAASVRGNDFLLALNNESLGAHLPDLSATGLAICMDRDRGDVEDPRLRSLSEEAGPAAARGEKFVGVKLLSLLFTLMGFRPETLRKAVEAQFGKKLKPEVLQANLDAIDAVAATVDAGDVHAIPFPPAEMKDHLLLSGNDAIALGMVAAGVGVYVGYPMTPSTSILDALASYGPEVGIAVEQVEDEVSALNAAVGASYAGARAATGSSGAGMGLMAEAMGLAGITETPVVIVDAQRAGPSTGMATRTEQSDLLFVIHASHGEFPRAVIAPATTEEGFYLAAEAFNIADRWQIPVFLMDDMAFADAETTVPRFDISRVRIDRGPLAPEPDEVQLLRRYAVTESGVSPRAFPVLSRWLVACDSHEHDEMGRMSDHIGNRNRQFRKRMRKLTGIAAEFPGPEIVGAPADDLVICWGSTVGPVLEATRLLRKRGVLVATGIFRYLYPMDRERVAEALSGFRRIFSVEGNYTGQLGRLIQMETCIRIHGHIGKVDGRAFTVEDVTDRIEKALGGAS